MTPADRLRAMMIADPRPDAVPAKVAGMSAVQWGQYKHGKRTPGIEVAGRILDALGHPFASLDPPRKRREKSAADS